jgi:hypothetical protein
MDDARVGVVEPVHAEGGVLGELHLLEQTELDLLLVDQIV